jgi:trans-2,3-dihydro-3-hydroxyanthranilate isomerase
VTTSIEESQVARRFTTLDVFTARRFAGNPLAVVLDADGLDTAAMQAIAREFNYPETVFVLPPLDPAHRARLRIFTPARELPFAGHPTVGTAVLLARLDGGSGSSGTRDIVLEEDVGIVPCTVELLGDGGGRARFGLPRLPMPAGDPPDEAAIATSLRLAPGDLGFGALRPSCWSAGNPFVFVPVASLAAIGRCRPDGDALDRAVGDRGVYVFCAETVEPGHDFHARMFGIRLGIREDPATGSAAAAFAGLLAARGNLPDGEHAIAIEQGYEMGRPSLIRLTLVLAGGRLVAAAVGGDAVIVMQGTIEI